MEEGGGGGRCTPLPCCVFCSLLKNLNNQKILVFSQLFIADAPIKKKHQNIVLTLRRLLSQPVADRLILRIF